MGTCVCVRKGRVRGHVCACRLGCPCGFGFEQQSGRWTRPPMPQTCPPPSDALQARLPLPLPCTPQLPMWLRLQAAHAMDTPAQPPRLPTHSFSAWSRPSKSKPHLQPQLPQQPKQPKQQPQPQQPLPGPASGALRSPAQLHGAAAVQAPEAVVMLGRGPQLLAPWQAEDQLHAPPQGMHSHVVRWAGWWWAGRRGVGRMEGKGACTATLSDGLVGGGLVGGVRGA